jgi:uncharacterized membrane protein
MRSWPELDVTTASAALAASAALVLLTCCDAGSPTPCESSTLTYQTFGDPFIANWCRSCHSSELPPEMRQLAPLNVNFNSRADVLRFSRRISFLVVTSETMPPAGGPTERERALLADWIACGARE